MVSAASIQLCHNMKTAVDSSQINDYGSVLIIFILDTNILFLTDEYNWASEPVFQLFT